MRRRLNAFFAISVNSPLMSMVNYSCGVCSALNAGSSTLKAAEGRGGAGVAAGLA